MQYILVNIKNGKLDIIDKKYVLDKLYYLEYRPLTNSDIQNNTDEEILKIIKSDKNIVTTMKNEISKIEEKIPLYDIYSENIFLITKCSVYERVTNQSYRFPEKSIIDELKKRKKNFTKTTDYLEKRKLRKIDLMEQFMSYFNIDILYKTYVNVFNKYSKFAGREITLCRNPSFLPQFYHIKPYFTRNELINIGLNREYIKDNIEDTVIERICRRVKKNEISYKTLLKHRKYMRNKISMGYLQFYTLQGSSLMNDYLRNLTNYNNKNLYLEELIVPMWSLVLSSPEFDTDVILYRFIDDDSYIQNLKVGDIFIEKGFMSTTRDSFYKSDTYQFGLVLIKINIDKNISGVALCLETISHFPEEQEIIFPPNSKFELIKKDNNVVYFHTDIKFSSKIKTKYEFKWIENEKKIIFSRNINPLKLTNVNFMKLKKITGILANKIKEFEQEYVNSAHQFMVNMGENDIVVFTEQYNSTGAYKNFYAVKTKLGFAIYAIFKGYMLFFIEIAEVNKKPQMHVNYYVKYNAIDPNIVVGDEKLLLFYASIAYYFDIPTIIIYANYMSCSEKAITDNDIQRSKGGDKLDETDKLSIKSKINETVKSKLFGGNYCVDFYKYFTQNEKKYDHLNTLNIELYPEFTYHDLDILKDIPPAKVLKKEDNEVYQIYNKVYLKTKNKNSIVDFYIWLKDTKCYLVDDFIQTLCRILGKNNPFEKDWYTFDPIAYLYNRNYIKVYTSKFQFIEDVKRDKPKNKKK